MKVSDLMASADKIFATQTGRKLAKMFRAQGLAPTFSQFCSEERSKPVHDFQNGGIILKV